MHGGDIYRNKNMLDFSANLNPLGMPEAVLEAARRAVGRSEAYPDPECETLIRELAQYEGVKPAEIICGNGAADLIYGLVYARRPRRALVTAPSFSEYECALRCVDCQMMFYYESAAEGFGIKEDFIEYLETDLDMVFLCNPNNPTGTLLEKEMLERIVKRCEEAQIFLVMDECFLDFLEEKEEYSIKPYIEGSRYLFLLKAFTKLYAMPGLRLGYGICGDVQFLSRLRTFLQPWNVSLPAQEAGIAALKENTYLQESRQVIAAERQWLADQLKALGMQVYPPSVNYVFFRGNEMLYEVCRENGVLIRDCRNYRGLEKGWFRTAVRTRDENRKLIDVIKRSGIWQKKS